MSTSLRIAYAGTPEFAVPALKSIESSNHQLVAVLTQPDRKSGRGRKISESPVKQSLTSSNVHVMQPENVNDPDIIRELKALKLDLIVVAAYGQIFSQDLLDLPRLGCINIHASLLPKWRGASPIQHAILKGDGKSGVTIMQMAKRMDAGDIWLQSSCAIEEVDTSETLHNKLAKLGGEIILQGISKVADGELTPVPQDESHVTYCNKLKKTDGLIDWTDTAISTSRMIRAFYPWPGAYTYLGNRRLRITKAEIADNHGKCNIPGQVVNISKEGFTVACRGGQGILIKELVPEGGKKVTAMDFCNANVLESQQLGNET